MARSLFGHDLTSKFFQHAAAARRRYLRKPERLVGKVVVGMYPVELGARGAENFVECRVLVRQVSLRAGVRTLLVGVSVEDGQPRAVWLDQMQDWRVKKHRR